jgi:hypothetical protein
MKMSTRRIGYTLAMVALLPLVSGCTGSFGLTRKVYGFNEQAHSDKWAKEGIFVLLCFPYGMAAVMDAVFFNAVEFWTGEKLIADASRPDREFRDEYKQPAPAPALTPAPRTAPSKATPAKKRAPQK